MNIFAVKKMSFVLSVLGIFALTASAQTPDFATEVLPILKNRCFECHSAPYKDKRGRMRFPKAGLRLDGKEFILEGGVVVAKSPQTSTLVEFISLPAGDPDIMPPRGNPLSSAQVQTIYNWVNDGADFGKWTGEAKKAIKKTEAPVAATTAKSVKVLQQLGAGLKPLDDSVLKSILPNKAQVTAVYPGSGLLRVSFARSKEVVTNDDLKKLKPIASRIAELNLSGSTIDDKGLNHLTNMSKLFRLDLHKCSVSDKGMSAIGGLKELRFLNLYGTNISDAGLPYLSMLKRLDSLYVWQTKVTEAGAQRMKKILPKTKISHKLVLPEPPAPTTGNNRRRRQ